MIEVTPSFKAAWASLTSRRPIALAQIDLPGRSLFVATDSIRIGTQQYEPILGAGTISNAGKFLSTSLALASAQFTLIDKPTSFGASLVAFLAAYQWVGAGVTIWFTDRSLTLIDDALPKFSGVIQTYSVKTGAIAVTCSQSREFNRTITPQTVTRANNPQAPDAAVGGSLTTWYGAVRGLPMRSPHTARYGPAQRYREDYNGGDRVGKGILVDIGRGGGASNPPAKVMVSGHALKTLGQTYPAQTGTNVFMRGKDGRAHVLEVWGDVFNAADGAGFYLRDTPTTYDAVTTASGNPVISRVAGWSGVVSGMRIASSGQIRPDTQVLSIAGTNLTMSRTASGSASGVDLVFEAFTAWAPVPYSRIDTGVDERMANELGFPNLTIDNPNALLDPSTEFAYCRLDTHGAGGLSGGAGAVVARFGDVEAQGTAVDVEFVVTYRTSAVVASVFLAILQTHPGTSETAIYGPVLLPASTSITTRRISLVADCAGWPSGVQVPSFATSQYKIEMGIAAQPPWDGDVSLPPYQYGSLDWFQAGAAVRYTPSQLDLTTGKTLVPVVLPRPSSNSGIDSSSFTTYTEKAFDTNVSDQTGEFFANVEGWADPDGTFTGSAGALVERPPDVVNHILQTYGGVDPLAITTGAGALGSFVDARAALKTWAGTDMVLGFSFSTPTAISALLSWIMSASVSDVWRATSDGSWRFLPWLPAPALTFPRLLTLLDLMDPTTGPALAVTPDANALSGLSVNHGYDALAGGYLHTSAATASSSVAGFEFHSMRDGGPFVVVTTGDDAVDVIYADGSTATVLLPAGTYTRESIIGQLCSSFGSGWSFGFGDEVVVLKNDCITTTVGAATVNAYMTPGTYTCEARATEAARALNAVTAGGGWAVTYNRATRRYTFARAGGGYLAFGSGDMPSRSAAALFGFASVNHGFGTTWTAPGEVEEGRLGISVPAAATLRWRNGPKGLLGTKTSAWELLGFDWVVDANGVVDAGSSVSGTYFVADCPRFELEGVLASANAVTGEKTPVQVDGRCLYDGRTAVEVRNRLVALLPPPRGVVTFASETLPELERGDVFGFSADVDGLRPYGVAGTDGSWAGKVFRVLEEHANFGDAWHSEIVAIDLTN